MNLIGILKRGCSWRTFKFLHKINSNFQINSAIRHLSITKQPQVQSLSSSFSKKFEENKSFQELYDNFIASNKSNEKIRYEKFGKIINAMQSTSSSSSTSETQNLFLLEYLADNYLPTKSDERLQLFNKIWSCVKKIPNNNNNNKEILIAALKVHQINRTPLVEIENFINECKSQCPDSLIYENLIVWQCEIGNITGALETLAEMRENNIAITEKIFNSLIIGYSRVKDLTNCESVLELMSATNVGSTLDTKVCLLQAYIENNAVEKFHKLLNSCVSERLSSQQVARILSSATVETSNGSTEIIKKIILLLPDDMLNAKEIQGDIRNLCVRLIRNNQPETAFIILNSFPTLKFDENHDNDTFGVFFITELMSNSIESKKIIELCTKLLQKNPRALHIACEMVLKHNTDASEIYLKALKTLEPLRSHYFWPLFLHSCQKNGEAGILNTLKLMKNLSVECDEETFALHCIPNLKNLLRYDPNKAIEILDGCGLKTSQLFPHIIRNLLYNQEFEKIIKINDQYHTTKLNLNEFISTMINVMMNLRSTKLFGEAIQSLLKKSSIEKYDFIGHCLLEIIVNPGKKLEINSFHNLLKVLENNNVKISVNTREILEDKFNEIKNTEIKKQIQYLLSSLTDKNLTLPSKMSDSPSIITHPRDMNLDQLECHLIELESKKFNTRGVLRRMLQLCVRENRLERALEIKQKCDEYKLTYSPGMMSCIFDLYVKLKDLDKATLIYQEIQKNCKGFYVDDYKIIDFVTLMVEKNKLNEAKQFLINYTKNVKIKTGNHILKNLWNLLNQTAIYGSSIKSINNEAKIFFDLLKNIGYCENENVLLGPIIRECILKNNLQLAVQEFKNMVQNFRKTPLQYELISILVKVANDSNLKDFNISQDEVQSLLQEVIELCSSIHGSINTNSSFLLAIAEFGTVTQLRKMLINPEFKINSQVLINNCEHLSQAGKNEAILRLAKAGRGLNNFNEQDLYNTILNQFRKDNNYISAMQLFEKLEAEDDLKISQEFVKSLVNLLKINNIEIPTNIAIRLRS